MSSFSGRENKTYFGAYLADIGKKLYLNAKTADVYFTFGLADGTVKRIAAHRSVLAATSDVFDAMFYGELKEKGDVYVTDASEAAFMEFLQFFYLEQVKLTIENITDVMYLGTKYNVPNCINACVAFLRDVLSVDNIFIGLNLAIVYDHKELLKNCEKFIALNTAEVIQSNGFLGCDRQALAYILNMDILSCPEGDVFKGCMEWVRTKSEHNTLTKELVVEHLGDLYYEIRFASMTVPELCFSQAQYGSVLQSDFATITNMIFQPEFQAENFKKDPRHAKWNADAVVKCDRKSKKKSAIDPFILNKDSTYTTTFSSDEPLLLGSFVCSSIKYYGSTYRDLTSDLPVEVEVFEVRDPSDTNTNTNTNGNGNALLKMTAKLQSQNDNHIQLSHPVLVRPGYFYKICIGQFPADHVYFSEKLQTTVYLNKSLAWMGSTVQYVQFHNCSNTENESAIGLISCLNFNKLFVDE